MGKVDYRELAVGYLQACGGKDNLEHVDNCVTRLRIEVKDSSKVDDAACKQLGSKGVIRLGKKNVQIIIGTDVEFIADELKALL